MDFIVSKSDLIAALEQILQGRKEDSGDVIDLAVDQSTLSVVITGRSVEIAAEASEQGRAGIPIHVMSRIRQMLKTYKEESVQIQISEGKLLLQNNSIAEPGIEMKELGRRAIDIPDDAPPIDILSLPGIYSWSEIKDSGLEKRVHEAEYKLKDDLYSTSKILEAYGFSRAELENMARHKIHAHTKSLKPVLVSEE